MAWLPKGLAHPPPSADLIVMWRAWCCGLAAANAGCGSGGVCTAPAASPACSHWSLALRLSNCHASHLASHTSTLHVSPTCIASVLCVQARACSTQAASWGWLSACGTSRLWAPTPWCSPPATQPPRVRGSGGATAVLTHSARRPRLQGSMRAVSSGTPTTTLSVLADQNPCGITAMASAHWPLT